MEAEAICRHELPQPSDTVQDALQIVYGAKAILARYNSTIGNYQNVEAWTIATIFNPLYISHTDAASFSRTTRSNTDSTTGKNFLPEDNETHANKIVEGAKNIADQLIIDIHLEPWTVDATHALSDLSYEPDFLQRLTTPENRGAFFDLQEIIIAQRQKKQAQLAENLDGKIPQYVSDVETYIVPLTILTELIQPKNTILTRDGKANLIERLANLLYVDESHRPQREDAVRMRLQNALKDLDYDMHYMTMLGRLSEQNLLPFEPKPQRADKEWDRKGEVYAWLQETLAQELGLDRSQPIHFDNIADESTKLLDGTPAKYNRVLLRDNTGREETYTLPVFVENQFGQLIRQVSVGDFVRIYKTDPQQVYEGAILHGTRLFEKPRIIITQHDGKETFSPILGLFADFRHQGPELMREALDRATEVAKLALPQREYDPLLVGPMYREHPYERFYFTDPESPANAANLAALPENTPQVIYGPPLVRTPRAALLDNTPWTQQSVEPNPLSKRQAIRVLPFGRIPGGFTDEELKEMEKDPKHRGSRQPTGPQVSLVVDDTVRFIRDEDPEEERQSVKNPSILNRGKIERDPLGHGPITLPEDMMKPIAS